MNAIEMLTQQHGEVKELFEELEGASARATKSKERIFRKIADAMAIHAAIEERLFYPESKTPETEELLRESLEEHLSVKRVIADLLAAGPKDKQFDARCKVLKEQIEHHVEEEEHTLFPKVEEALSEEQLDELGDRMQQLAEQLEEQGEPSAAIPGETGAPPQI